MVLSPYFLQPTGNQDLSNATINDGGSFVTTPVLDDISTLRIQPAVTEGVRFDFASAVAELWYHMFVQFGSLMSISGSQNGTFVRICKNPTSLMELRFNPTTKKIEAWVGGSLVATGSKVLNADQSYHLQLRYKIHDSTGAIQLKIDTGTATYDIDFSGDTKPGSDATFDQLRLMNTFQPGGSYVYFSSIYVDDAAFQGIVRMKTYRANRDGNYTAWLKSTGSVAYVLVDETPPNGDTDFIYSQTVNQKQSVGFEPFDGPSNSVILANVHMYNARKISSGSFDAYGRSNSTDGTPLNIIPGSDYRTNSNIMLVDPDTGIAWTVARLQDQTATGVEAVSEMKA